MIRRSLLPYNQGDFVFFDMYVIVSRQVSPALRHGGEHGQTNAEDVLRFGTQGLTSWRRSTE